MAAEDAAVLMIRAGPMSCSLSPMLPSGTEPPRVDHQ